LGQLVTEVSQQHPIYRTEPMELDLAIAGERPAGALVQIEPK
jgi:hypothetical protein